MELTDRKRNLIRELLLPVIFPKYYGLWKTVYEFEYKKYNLKGE